MKSDILESVRHNFTLRLLLIIFLIISVGFFAIEVSLKMIITRELLSEKERMLFGLTKQLDTALGGSFNDILEERSALQADRDTKIALLNRELAAVTDFVASGIEGVGVGYYSRELDAIVTYGPSGEFQHNVGRSIFHGHQGYDVMASGKPMVQEGELVRGKILNCMYPINRGGEVIGYIWANETLSDISLQMDRILNRVFLFLLLIFLIIYGAVVLITRGFIGQIDRIRDGIQQVIARPVYRLPEIHGELNIIVEKVNELSDSVSYFKSYNRYVLDSVVNGVLALTESGTIALVNPSFRTMFDLNGQDIVGKDAREIFRDPLMALLGEGLSTDQPVTSQIFATGNRIMEVSGNVIRSDLYERLGVVYVFRDITLMRQYESQLKENERMAALGEMGLNVAHEIKNPLTAVKGFTQLMQKRDFPEERKDYFFSLINEELQRVNGLLNEMLIYGGRFKLQPDDVDLNGLLLELLIIYRSVYLDIEFNPDFGKKSCTLRIDKNKITQLLDNLVKNSVDAIRTAEKFKEGGTGKIAIILLCGKDEVLIKIRDNGPGIDPPRMEKIFTPFYTTKPDGSGFGLSLCAEIMDKHKGNISVESTPGEFSEFTVRFSRKALETIDGA